MTSGGAVVQGLTLQSRIHFIGALVLACPICPLGVSSSDVTQLVLQLELNLANESVPTSGLPGRGPAIDQFQLKL